MVTEQEARDMQAEIIIFETKDTDQRITDIQNLIRNEIPIFFPRDLQAATTRTEALINFNAALNLVPTNDIQKRIKNLKINEANEVYKRIKRSNPNS